MAQCSSSSRRTRCPSPKSATLQNQRLGSVIQQQVHAPIHDLVTAVRVFFMCGTDLVLEILALRQQVAVLKRKRPRPAPLIGILKLSYFDSCSEDAFVSPLSRYIWSDLDEF
jgi:hypothetical protein